MVYTPVSYEYVSGLWLWTHRSPTHSSRHRTSHLEACITPRTFLITQNKQEVSIKPCLLEHSCHFLLTMATYLLLSQERHWLSAGPLQVAHVLWQGWHTPWVFSYWPCGQSSTHCMPRRCRGAMQDRQSSSPGPTQVWHAGWHLQQMATFEFEGCPSGCG